MTLLCPRVCKGCETAVEIVVDLRPGLHIALLGPPCCAQYLDNSWGKLGFAVIEIRHSRYFRLPPTKTAYMVGTQCHRGAARPARADEGS